MSKTIILQYYYRVNSCPAEHPTDKDCICWHDEGTGTYKDVRHYDHPEGKSWRVKPTHHKGETCL